MKLLNKNSIVQKIIISILTVLLLTNFIVPTYSNAASAADTGGVLLSPVVDLVCSLGDVVINLLQVSMMGGFGTQKLNYSLSAFMEEASEFYKNNEDPSGEPDEKIDTDKEFTKGWLWNKGDYYIPVATYSPEQIFTGNVAGLDVNFINPNKYTVNNKAVDSSAAKFQPVISSWYVALRNLSVVALLCILAYIGIRMILTSTAGEKAKYKQMLVDWIVALCLVFFLHYLMSFILTMTESVCTAIAGDGEKSYIIEDTTAGHSFATNLLGAARFKTQYKDIGKKVTYLIFYIALLYYTVVFTLYYLKRMFMMAFLTLIAPLVAITYPIDKMGDGKSQAFNKWLTEYVLNAIIQPFHLIMYIVFVKSAMDFASDHIIYMIATLWFISKAEKMLKQLFGLDKGQLGTMGGIKDFALGSIFNKALGGRKGGGGRSLSGGKSDSSENEKLPSFQGKHDIGDIYNTEDGKDGEDGGNTKLSPPEEYTDGEDGGNTKLSPPEEYTNEGFGQNAEGHFFNPYIDEYDENYNPNNDPNYKKQNEEEKNNPNTPLEGNEEDSNGKKSGKLLTGLTNLARYHNIPGAGKRFIRGANKTIKGAVKLGTNVTFKAAAGSLAGAVAIACGGNLTEVLAAAATGTSLGGVAANGLGRAVDMTLNAPRNIKNTINNEIDIFNGNSDRQKETFSKEFKKDENNIKYIRDMLTKQNGGVIPSSKEVKEKMNSFDPYIKEGLTDIRDMIKGQKAEKYVGKSEAAKIAAFAKENGYNDKKVLSDPKMVEQITKNLKQSLKDKNYSEDNADKVANHAVDVMKAQNGVAHNLKTKKKK